MDAARPGLTEVALCWIEGRQERWLRFGRVASERILDRRRRTCAFRPGAVFAFVNWSADLFGTRHSAITICRAVEPGEPVTQIPFVAPGGELLLSIAGWPRVRRVLGAIDAVEEADIDACDVAPDHWRHMANRIGCGLAFRPYGRERHEAWLRRRRIEP